MGCLLFPCVVRVAALRCGDLSPRCPQIHRLWTGLWVPVRPTFSANTPGLVHRPTCDATRHPWPRHPSGSRRDADHEHAQGPGSPPEGTFLTHRGLRMSLCTTCAPARPPGDDRDSPTPWPLHPRFIHDDVHSPAARHKRPTGGCPRHPHRLRQRRVLSTSDPSPTHCCDPTCGRTATSAVP